MSLAQPALIEAARGGDPQAIAQLLVVCQPDLKRFARRACANSEDAEDAVQVALWRLHARIGALRTTAAFVTWLFRIVERECRRLLFLRPKEQPMDWSVLEAKPAPDIPQDLRLDLSRAIAALAPPYRDVLLLRDVDGLTAPETAQQLGLSLETVKTRLRRAREFLRESLIASGYFSKEEGGHVL